MDLKDPLGYWQHRGDMGTIGQVPDQAGMLWINSNTPSTTPSETSFILRNLYSVTGGNQPLQDQMEHLLLPSITCTSLSAKHWSQTNKMLANLTE